MPGTGPYKAARDAYIYASTKDGRPPKVAAKDTRVVTAGLFDVRMKAVGEALEQLEGIARVLSADGTPPVGFKRYIAMLNQSSTSAPVATVLENTLDDTPVWSRSDTGHYILTLSGAFTVGKTRVILPSPSIAPGALGGTEQYAGGSDDANTCYLRTGKADADADGLLYDNYSYFEVIVYD